MRRVLRIGLPLAAFSMPGGVSAQFVTGGPFQNFPLETYSPAISRVLGSTPQDIAFCSKEARRRTGQLDCVYFVNASKYKIVEFYYAFKEEEYGPIAWSANQLKPDRPFEAMKWTPFRKPPQAGCYLALKYVMLFKGKRMQRIEVDNVCGSVQNAFVPIWGPRKGLVFVEAEPADTGTSNPQTASPPAASTTPSTGTIYIR